MTAPSSSPSEGSGETEQVCLHFAVTDTGAGIERGLRQRIFDWAIGVGREKSQFLQQRRIGRTDDQHPTTHRRRAPHLVVLDKLQRIDHPRMIATAHCQPMHRPKADTEPAPVLRGEHAFARGFAVAFANPKTLIFHAAFLPQFLVPGQNRTDLWLLAATFAVIGALGDGLYA